MPAVPISVIICCNDSQDTLEHTIQSVAWADEVIVVDSGSKDATAEIARRLATQYVLEPWRGHTGQKQFATSLCRNDWVFIIDGDEECSDALTADVARLTAKDFEQYDLFMIARTHYVMGQPVRAWWPDRISRLFHRQRCTWDGHVLHDQRCASSPDRVKNLNGYFIHKRLSNGGWADYFSGKRMDDRLLSVARQMHDKGKRCHWWDLILRPWGAFFKSYILKRGFLDGTFGLLIAQKSSVSTQLKYAALWCVQNGLDKKV